MSRVGPFVPTSISEWGLRGVVQRDQVGKVLEALFLSGASHLDIAPFVQGLAPVNGSSRLSPVETLALPPPKNSRSAKEYKTNQTPQYPESANQVIVKVLRRRAKGMNYAAFLKYFLNLGRAASSVGANLSHARKAGLIVKNGAGAYTLAPGYETKFNKITASKNGDDARPAKAPKRARAKYGSVRPEVMRVLQEALPEGLAPFQISNKISVPHKMGAVNSALAVFVDRKAVKRKNGKYVAVKLKSSVGE